MQIDVRAAAANEGEPKEFRITDECYLLCKPELPLHVVDLVQQGRFIDALTELMVTPDREYVIELAPTLSLLEAIIGAYGSSLGESGASPRPSTSTGLRARPTSNGSTGSTFAPSARAG